MITGPAVPGKVRLHIAMPSHSLLLRIRAICSSFSETNFSFGSILNREFSLLYADDQCLNASCKSLQLHHEIFYQVNSCCMYDGFFSIPFLFFSFVFCLLFFDILKCGIFVGLSISFAWFGLASLLFHVLSDTMSTCSCAPTTLDR